MGGIAVANVQNDIHIIQHMRIGEDILKADEPHIKRCTGERFNHACIAVILLIIQRMMHHMAAPRAHLSPAIQNSDGFHAIRRRAADILIQLAELIAHALHIIEELRELASQFEIAAVADAVNRLAQNGAARRHPVFPRFLHGVSALMERIRKEIRQQTSFRIFHAGDVADEPERRAVAHTADHRVQTNRLEFRHKRFRADPMVAKEHHRFFSALMGDFDHFPRQSGDFPTLERLEIPEFLAGHAILVIEISLIDDILRTEAIADFLLEFLQNIRRNGGRITVPIDVLFPPERIEHQRKLMEERRVANHVHIGMLLDEAAQTLHGKLMGLGLANIERNLMLDILPVVDNGVVHVNRIPDEIAQEGHRVFMIRRRMLNHDAPVRIMPFIRGQRLAGRAVDDLPPAADIVAGIDLQQLGREVFHQTDRQRTLACHLESGHDIALLHLVGVRLRPRVVLAGGVVSRIHLCAGIAKLLREVGSVAVADRVRSPSFAQFKRFGHNVHIGRNGYAPAVLLLVHHRFFFLSQFGHTVF